MADLDPIVEDDFEPDEPTEGEVKALFLELQERCKTAGIPFEKVEGLEDDDVCARISLPVARERRWVFCWDHGDYTRLLSTPFEQYTFIPGFDAICSYATGTIEALVRPISGTSRTIYAKLFGLSSPNEWESASLTVESPEVGPKTTITLSPATSDLYALVNRTMRNALSLKIKREGIRQSDQATALLQLLSNAVFFQIDMLTDLPLSLSRNRQSKVRPRAKSNNKDSFALNYPRNEFDSAPISLYWYARSAVGMPLLQFLAFYQVIEFYYPTYSQAEARRRLKGVLKDPTFRADRDADIGRVLSTIQFARSGALGDERSQLKATLNECLDPDALRAFIVDDTQRSEFLSSKAKGLTDHRLPIATANLDLRNDVAERIYDIRCKIVHTKTDARNTEVELLLPFSKESEQLHFDIELVQYIAQQVLVAASSAI